MTTIESLKQEKTIVKLVIPLRENELELRTIYVSQRFISWMKENMIEFSAKNTDMDLSPKEQMYKIFRQYVIGEDFDSDRKLKCLHPNGKFIWEFKSVDLRVFGWFYKPGIFICVAANFTDIVKKSNLYAGYVNEAVKFRIDSGLDKPNFVNSLRYCDVL